MQQRRVDIFIAQCQCFLWGRNPTVKYVLHYTSAWKYRNYIQTHQPIKLHRILLFFTLNSCPPVQESHCLQ